uniref:Uncharacterized protein n=1 Tax=Oryza punctata TaxID=4537 RepID=A0A0E0KV87_ORYPU
MIAHNIGGDDPICKMIKGCFDSINQLAEQMNRATWRRGCANSAAIAKAIAKVISPATVTPEFCLFPKIEDHFPSQGSRRRLSRRLPHIKIQKHQLKQHRLLLVKLLRLLKFQLKQHRLLLVNLVILLKFQLKLLLVNLLKLLKFQLKL